MPIGLINASVRGTPIEKDLGTTEFPKVETGSMDGEIAFRQHSAGQQQRLTGRCF